MTTAAAPLPFVQMTAAEFAAKHADFKATIDGRPYVLADCGAEGTCLVPVALADAVLREICGWCKAVIVEGDAGALVSHVICDPCVEKMG